MAYYLYFSAINNLKFKLNFKNGNSNISYMEYSYNGINWYNYTNNQEIVVNDDVGDYVSIWIRGVGGTYLRLADTSSGGTPLTLQTTDDNGIRCYGSLAAILNYTYLVTTLAEGAFSYLFDDRVIVTPPLLPWTDLSRSPKCYYHLFQSCSDLKIPPELPATSISTSCYEGMFNGTGISSPLPLPALTPKEYSYKDMFPYAVKVSYPTISQKYKGASYFATIKFPFYHSEGNVPSNFSENMFTDMSSVSTDTRYVVSSTPSFTIDVNNLDKVIESNLLFSPPDLKDDFTQYSLTGAFTQHLTTIRGYRYDSPYAHNSIGYIFSKTFDEDYSTQEFASVSYGDKLKIEFYSDYNKGWYFTDGSSVKYTYIEVGKGNVTISNPSVVKKYYVFPKTFDIYVDDVQRGDSSSLTTLKSLDSTYNNCFGSLFDDAHLNISIAGSDGNTYSFNEIKVSELTSKLYNNSNFTKYCSQLTNGSSKVSISFYINTLSKYSSLYSLSNFINTSATYYSFANYYLWSGTIKELEESGLCLYYKAFDCTLNLSMSSSYSSYISNCTLYNYDIFYPTVVSSQAINLTKAAGNGVTINIKSGNVLYFKSTSTKTTSYRSITAGTPYAVTFYWDVLNKSITEGSYQAMRDGESYKICSGGGKQTVQDLRIVLS